MKGQRCLPLADSPARSRRQVNTQSSSVRQCSAELGAVAAKVRLDVCRDVSPATGPPYNAVNSRALFDGDDAPMKGFGLDPKGSQAAADVVRCYYSAIDTRLCHCLHPKEDYGQPGQALTAFEKGFSYQ